MHAPYIVVDNLSPEQCARWEQQFAQDGRDIAEGMWRRSHDEYTHQKFGTKLSDKRRRLVHFLDKYEIVENAGHHALAITQSYLYICSTLPEKDATAYWQRHKELAVSHGWFVATWGKKHFHIEKDGYEINGTFHNRHPYDRTSEFPADYRTLEIVARTTNERILKSKRETPWGVWSNKYRRPIPREEPAIITDLRELADYFPMHVELGCGPSLEAGIPPLSELHHIYSAADYASGKFMFGEDDTLLERVITDNAAFYESAAKPYKTCFLAKPTPFYKLLRDMRERGLVLGPLINNNFDGIAKLVGFEELYIRRYETTEWIPDITFSPKAKSILVVGSHADRRLVRVHARQAGLKVIYVDPEGYYNPDESFTSYPLEALDASDLLVRMTAAEFAEVFRPVVNEIIVQQVAI